MEKKKPKKHWVYIIVPVFAFTVGIVMASVGGIMSLNATAKMFLFESGPYGYISPNECRYDNFIAPVPVAYDIKNIDGIKNPKQRSEEEIKKCLTERKNEEKIRFLNKEKQSLVDGLSALIVGLILILVFKKKNLS